uniref:Uncharacterized protein n=1 Tax=Rhipicephalus microplus TaxID=6941 RepID=A0A6G5AGU3_RHIMP
MWHPVRRYIIMSKIFLLKLNRKSQCDGRRSGYQCRGIVDCLVACTTPFLWGDRLVRRADRFGGGCLTVDNVDDVVHSEESHLDTNADLGAADVRSHNQVPQSEQLAGLGQWLGNGDVDCGGPDDSILQGVVEVILVDDTTPAGVDEDGSFLHLGKEALVEHAPSLVGQVGQGDEEVRLGCDFVNAAVGGAELLRRPDGVKLVIVDGLANVKSDHALQHTLCDVAHADEAHGGTVKPWPTIHMGPPRVNPFACR